MIFPDVATALGQGNISTKEKNADYNLFTVVRFRNRSSGAMHIIFTSVMLIFVTSKLLGGGISVENKTAYYISCVGQFLFVTGFCFPTLVSSVLALLCIKQHTKTVSLLNGFVDNFGQCCAIFSLGLFLISSGVDGKCSSSNQFWERIPCTHRYASIRLPFDLLIIVLLSPVLYSVVFGTLCPRVLFVSWSLSFSSLVISASLSQAESLFIYPFFSVVVGWILYESRKFLYFILKYNHQYYEIRHSSRSDSRSNTKLCKQMNILKQLIGNVIHDILTPMQALEIGVDTLHSMLVALGAQIIDADFWDLMQSMRGTLSLMSMIIHRCMDVAHSSDGSVLVAHYEIFDFTTVVSRVGRFMADMQSRIHLDVRFMPGIRSTQVHTDKRWFEDNMLCMLSNAVKYSRDVPGVKVLLKVFTSNSYDCCGNLRKMLTVEVWDSGVVMTAEQRSELFSMPDMDDRKEMGGAGLGLFSMACRVSALGGVLGSRNRDDELCDGSIFWFSIPCDSRILDQSDDRSSSHSSDSSVESSWHSSHSSPRQMMSRQTSSKYISFHIPSGSDETYADNHADNNMTMDDNDRPYGTAILARSSKNISPFSLVTPVRRSFNTAMGADEAGDSHEVRSASSLNTSTGSTVHDASTGSRAGHRSKNKSAHANQRSLSRPSSFGAAVSPPPESVVFIPEFSRSSFPISALAQPQRREKETLSILIVDDSITVIKILKMSFTKDGHTVDLAKNGMDALTMMVQKEYDVVLMDLIMPGMNGCDAVKHFRKYESLCRSGQLQPFEAGIDPSSPSTLSDSTLNPNPALHVPNRHIARSHRQLVVCMSSSIDARSKMDALLSGMDAFLSKPFSRQAFMEIVGEKSFPVTYVESMQHSRMENYRGDVNVLARIAESVTEASILNATNLSPPSSFGAAAVPTRSAQYEHVDRDETQLPLLPGSPILSIKTTGSFDSNHHDSSHPTQVVSAGCSDEGAAHRSVVRVNSGQNVLEVKRRLSVLVEEDSRPILRVVVKNLENEGNRVEQAVNGREALHLMKVQQFDIVVMDLQMPEMGACEAVPLFRIHETELIAKGLRTTRQFIAGTSAHCADESRQQALASGMDVFLQKPFRTEALLTCWRDHKQSSSSVDTRGEKLPVDLDQPIPASILQPARHGVEKYEPKSHLSVLIVEDSIPIMKALTMNLKRAGHLVDQAVNGVFGLQAMQTNVYDIVLMDLQMPEMGGLEATRMFRLFEATTGRSSGRDMRQVIIGMSAHKDGAVEKEAAISGMDAFMPKPFKIEQMLALAVEKLAEGVRLE